MCWGREVASVVMMGDGGVAGEVLFVMVLLELHGGAEPECGGGLGLALRPLSSTVIYKGVS